MQLRTLDGVCPVPLGVILCGHHQDGKLDHQPPPQTVGQRSAQRQLRVPETSVIISQVPQDQTTLAKHSNVLVDTQSTWDAPVPPLFPRGIFKKII